MNNDRLEKLRSLLTTVNESITKQEFVTSFKAVLDFVKQIDQKNTAEFDNFKVQFKQLANSLKIDTESELDDLKTKVDSTLKDCMAEMMVEHDAKLQAMEVKMSQVRNGADGMDGKDADETKVVEMVLAKIPTLELDEPLDIVEKLESLQGEYRLDASAIKNLPEGKGGRWGGGLSRGVADTLYAPIGSSGGVDTANTPAANEFARFTDADTIEGLTVDETLTALGFTASITELNYTDGVTSAIQTQLNAKAPSTSPTFATSITGSYLTASEILITDASKNIVSAPVATYPSLTELTYLKGVTSAIQTQLNGKQASMGADDNYVTDAQLVVIGNTSGTNTGDQDITGKADKSGALTQFVGNTAWRVFYSDASGDVTELALGADGTFLKSNGASSAPTFATPAGSGDVSKVGTPANNQVGVWTGDGTIEGDAALTFDTATDYFGIGTASPDRTLHAEMADNGTNAVAYAARLTHITSDTATTNFGVGQEYEAENASGTNRILATTEAYYTDATDASEDANFAIKLIKAGSVTSAFTFSHSMNRLFSGTGGTGITIPASGGTAALVAANGEFDFIPNTASDIGLRVITVGVYGTGDLFFQAKPGASGYGVFEGYGGLGTVIGSDNKIILAPARTEYLRLDSNLMTFKDALDMVFNTTTGTKIGTGTTQKIGFWNATPIVQPANTVAIDDLLVNTGLRASGGVANFTADVTVPDDAYDATTWNGNLEVPTKNAIRDKIESLSGGGITRSVVTTSGSVTLGATASTDYTYYVAGAHTLSMPSPNTNRYTVKNLHSAAITVDTAGAENIEGAASISLEPNDSVDIMSDGTNWFVH